MKPSLILHGGAGSMREMTDPRAVVYRDGLREAAQAGAAVLSAGGGALDAVVAVAVAMENSGSFNAGLGACLTSEGDIELDAAVMNGSDRGYGAVAAVKGVANPVVLARQIMEQTEHCLLGADGAARFARDQGLAFREDYPSELRKDAWRKRKERLKDETGIDSLHDRVASLGGVLGDEEEPPIGKGDTIGACAMDETGNLAAAVSTGGLWMKLPGRIGDSPLPGAGLWALNGLGAAVSTGTGEAILRVLLCREVVDRMNSGDATTACRQGIGFLTECFGTGSGGVVGIDAQGRPGFHFNTRGMGRATWLDGMTEPATGIWPDEDWDRPVLA